MYLKNNEINTENLIETLIELNTLKELPRTGWILRGIPKSECESIAEHTASLMWLALMAIPLLEKEYENNKIIKIDGRKILEMTLIHDIPEVRIGDIDRQGAISFGPEFKKMKKKGENLIFETLVSEISPTTENHLIEVWNEYRKKETLESRFVDQLDHIDAAIQALTYIDRLGYYEKLQTFFISLRSLKDSEFRIIRSLIKDIEEILKKKGK
ncbi:MAG: HD domain-containing protein [Candidatus Ranarchaeia archaeon]